MSYSGPVNPVYNEKKQIPKTLVLKFIRLLNLLRDFNVFKTFTFGGTYRQSTPRGSLPM